MTATNQTMIVQTRNAGVEYTKNTFCFDTSSKQVIGKATVVVSKAMAAKSIPDPTVTGFVTQIKVQLAPKLDVKIGKAVGAFAVGADYKNIIGSFQCDGMRTQYKTDFALINSGGIRSGLPASTYRPLDPSIPRPDGNSTVLSGPWNLVYGDAYTAFPFGNFVGLISISESVLWTMLENGVSVVAGRYPQISGFTFVYNATAPANQRYVNFQSFI
jgi:2',3'-cyclic-nucleotide 2'-phosphodiesterase (5'-nucleotidase family)